MSFIAGDFMKSSPSESKIPTPADGARSYVIRHVLHDWGDSQVITILRNVRNAMMSEDSATRPGPKLILVETVLTENASRLTRTTSLQLLSLNGGVVRSQGKLPSSQAAQALTEFASGVL